MECGLNAGHNAGCLTLSGTLKEQASHYVASLRHTLREVLEWRVPVSAAGQSRPIVDVVVSYLNDETNIISRIVATHRALDNPTVVASLSARRLENIEAIQKATAATHRRIADAVIPSLSCFVFLGVSICLPQTGSCAIGKIEQGSCGTFQRDSPGMVLGPPRPQR